ncbi:MAG: Swt1 family HEPN domain-containing protein [Ignavibacteria bacterium]|nr:Swt1 family HEPN domain-containing protein [Ignavibacteria bacterium]
MAEQLFDAALLEKLAKKQSKSSKYLKEQICKKAAKENVSSQAYFLYWLSKNDIPSARYSKKLPSEIKAEAHRLMDKGDGKRTHGVYKKPKIQNKIKQLIIENRVIEPKPPLFTAKLLAEANANAKLYPLIYILENILRTMIIEVMTRNHGKDWWNTKIKDTDLNNTILSKMKKEQMNPWLSNRNQERIYYTDFKDLAKIISNKPDDFNPLFDGLVGKISWIKQKLEELYLLRNNLAHSCPLSSKDRGLLETYFHNIYLVVDSLNEKIFKK